MQKVDLLTPEKNEIVSVISHMEDYFLKKGYKKLKKNSFIIKFLLKFYYKPFRKIRIFFYLIQKVNFIFKNPSKRDLIIYDTSNTFELLQILPNNNYGEITTRIDNIKNIHITKKILFYIILNFFKRSLKQNYIAALIESISPKLVVTNIVSSTDFHITAKIFEKKTEIWKSMIS